MSNEGDFIESVLDRIRIHEQNLKQMFKAPVRVAYPLKERKLDFVFRCMTEKGQEDTGLGLLKSDISSRLYMSSNI